MNPVFPAILMTPEQVAEVLGVSVETLNIWRSTKRYNLPYVKAGRLVRYRRTDVNRHAKLTPYRHPILTPVQRRIWV